MKENDRLQLIVPATIEHIAGLDGSALWQLFLSDFDRLRRLEKFRSPALHAPKDSDMTHIEKVFFMFYEEDPYDVRWGLIYDLGFLGNPILIDPWAASGYSDHMSSVGVRTSRDLMQDDELADHYAACLFDVLDSKQVDLIASSLADFKNLGFEDVPLMRLNVTTMVKTLESDTSLRAAYIYEISSR